VLKSFEPMLQELGRVKVSHYAHKVRGDNGITCRYSFLDSDGAENLLQYILILKYVYNREQIAPLSLGPSVKCGYSTINTC